MVTYGAPVIYYIYAALSILYYRGTNCAARAYADYTLHTIARMRVLDPAYTKSALALIYITFFLSSHTDEPDRGSCFTFSKLDVSFVYKEIIIQPLRRISMNAQRFFKKQDNCSILCVKFSIFDLFNHYNRQRRPSQNIYLVKLFFMTFRRSTLSIHLIILFM